MTKVILPDIGGIEAEPVKIDCSVQGFQGNLNLKGTVSSCPVGDVAQPTGTTILVRVQCLEGPCFLFSGTLLASESFEWETIFANEYVTVECKLLLSHSFKALYIA